MRQVAICAGVFWLAACSSAQADLQICNKSGTAIAVSFGTRTEYPGGAWQQFSSGWSRIENGSCASVFGGDLTGGGRAPGYPAPRYYVLVRDDQGVWDNVVNENLGHAQAVAFCYDPSADYSLIENNESPSSCSRQTFFSVDNAGQSNLSVDMLPRQ